MVDLFELKTGFRLVLSPTIKNLKQRVSVINFLAGSDEMGEQRPRKEGLSSTIAGRYIHATQHIKRNTNYRFYAPVKLKKKASFKDQKTF